MFFLSTRNNFTCIERGSSPISSKKTSSSSACSNTPFRFSILLKERFYMTKQNRLYQIFRNSTTVYRYKRHVSSRALRMKPTSKSSLPVPVSPRIITGKGRAANFSARAIKLTIGSEPYIMPPLRQIPFKTSRDSFSLNRS